jgi:hypothetical protein
MSEPRDFGKHHNEILAVLSIMQETWQRMDPKSNVALYPASYHETFLDMACAVVGDRYPGEVVLPMRAHDPLERPAEWQWGARLVDAKTAYAVADSEEAAMEFVRRLGGDLAEVVRRRPAGAWERTS